MMRRSLVTGVFVLGIAYFAATPSGFAVQDPAAFIGNLGTQAIQVLGPQVPASMRVARFRQLFREDFDVTGISQFVLGPYWRTISPQQRQEFEALFQEYVARAYSARLSEYAGQPFRVIGTRPHGSEIIVASQIVRSNGHPVEVNWVLRNHGGEYKITDIYVGGVSMKLTQRDEFASIIQNNGGRFDALLAVMRQKMAGAQ